MNCVGVGEANPDIAGVGILLSFGIQALIAVIVSIYATYLSLGTSIRKEVKRFIPGVYHIPPDLRTRMLVWDKKRNLCRDILLQGSDVQLVTGFALLLSAIIQYRNLSLYHLHIIYDAVSLVAISICASGACSLIPGTKHLKLRYSMIAVWSGLFLIYVILFGIRLKSWDKSLEGHCYSTVNLARPQDLHPLVDNIYVFFTCFYLFCTLIISMSLKEDAISILPDITLVTLMQKTPLSVLYIAMLQFPLHCYSIIVLRISNEKLLKGGSIERQWGFGQIAAMLVLGGNLLVLVNGWQDYRKWKSNGVSDEEGANLNVSRRSVDMGRLYRRDGADEAEMQEHGTQEIELRAVTENGVLKTGLD